MENNESILYKHGGSLYLRLYLPSSGSCDTYILSSKDSFANGRKDWYDEYKSECIVLCSFETILEAIEAVFGRPIV